MKKQQHSTLMIFGELTAIFTIVLRIDCRENKNKRDSLKINLRLENDNLC